MWHETKHKKADRIFNDGKINKKICMGKEEHIFMLLHILPM